MMIKLKISIFSLISSLINIIVINSESFCDDGKVDTAFTYENHTFLFRNDKVWIFDAQNKYMSKQWIQINDILIDARITSVDTIFDSFPEPYTIVYVFQKDRYFLLKPQKTQSSLPPVTFVPFGKEDDHNLPRKWSRYGNYFIDEWFPKKIDDSVVVKDKEIYLFHANKVRYTEIHRDWPSGNKIDYPFSGSLSSLEKIDASFHLPKIIDPNLEYIVLVEGLRYCSFRRVERNISLDFIDNCFWKDSREYFGCENESKPQDSTYSSSDRNEITKQTHNPEAESAEETTEKESSKGNSGFVTIAIIVGFILLLMIIAVVLSCSFIIYKGLQTTATASESDGFDAQSSRNSDKSTTSIVTVNSETGLIDN